MPQNKLRRLLTGSGSDADAAAIADVMARERGIAVYPASVNIHGGNCYFLGRNGRDKSLYILVFDAPSIPAALTSRLDAETDDVEPGIILLRCGLTHERASAIRDLFPFTRPRKLDSGNSFGFGDRLGIATPGHIRALKGVPGAPLFPVFAQQSIRELERTAREPQEVIDAATWGVFQEGWLDGFGADADHLKTTDDIDRMARVGFTMFTIDPGEYVVGEADEIPEVSLSSRVTEVDWEVLDDNIDAFLARYADVRFDFGEFAIKPDRETVLRAIVKYGNVIAHAIRMHRHLAEHWPGYETEVELSVDETDTPTSPFEHFMIANELKRRGIHLMSIAPRFIGDFEKGIDYRGDIERFREEYRKHAAITQTVEPYKLSLHSGSDKFSIYKVIGALPAHGFHVKTAGTSYLVALETIAATEPSLFRDILAFSRAQYETEKRSYHVSADLANVPEPDDLSDTDLAGIFTIDDVRQVLHVAFGRVLATHDKDGAYLFRDSIMQVLDSHEELHYELLQKHFTRHLTPLTCL